MRYVIAFLLRDVKAMRLWHVVMAQLSAVSSHGSHAEVVGVVYSNREMTTTEFVVIFVDWCTNPLHLLGAGAAV